MENLVSAAFYLSLAAAAIFLPRVDRYLRHGYTPATLPGPQLIGLLLTWGFVLSAVRYIWLAIRAAL